MITIYYPYIPSFIYLHREAFGLSLSPKTGTQGIGEMEINLFFAGGIFFSMLFTLTNKLCVLLWILLLHCGCLQQAFF